MNTPSSDNSSPYSHAWTLVLGYSKSSQEPRNCRQDAQRELGGHLMSLEQVGPEYLNGLTLEQLQEMHANISVMLDEVHCTSTPQDTRSMIQSIAALLGLPNGKLFHAAQPKWITLESCAYHIELEKSMSALSNLLRQKNPPILEATVLRDKILQIIGITMDQAFLLFNKTELEAFTEYNNAPDKTAGLVAEPTQLDIPEDDTGDLFPSFSSEETERFESFGKEDDPSRIESKTSGVDGGPKLPDRSPVELFSSIVSWDLQEFLRKLESVGTSQAGETRETREFKSILRRLSRQHHALLGLKSDIYNNGEVNSPASIARIKDALNLLEPVDKIRLFQSIHGARTGTSYTSNSIEARSRITFFAELLGTKNGEILYVSNPNGSGAERFEYHQFLVKMIQDLEAELEAGNDSIIRLETLRQSIFNVIGLAMDSTFLIFNKSELEPIITSIVEDLSRFYRKLSDIGSPVAGQSPIAEEFRANLKRSAEHYQAVLTINYITYYPGDISEGETILAGAVSRIDAHYKDPAYYYAIAEANRELFLAKRATPETRQASVDTLRTRLDRLTQGAGSTTVLFNGNVPEDMSRFTDDMFEVLTALVKLEGEPDAENGIRTEELINGIARFIRESRTTTIHQNERAYGFFLLFIEAIFESLLHEGRRLPPESTMDMARLTKDYLDETSRGNTMLEECSRIYLRIASVYGKIYADSLKDTSEGILADPDFNLIRKGKEAFLAGIYTYTIQDPERVKRLGGRYLDAFIRAYNHKHRVRPEVPSDNYVEEGFEKMTECWLDETSYVQKYGEEKRRLNFKRLESIVEWGKIKSIRDFKSCTDEICRITNEYFHGFFSVHIVPYGNRPPARWDIDTQRYDIGFGFEMIFESYSLRSETRNTFITSEFPEILQKIRQIVTSTLDSFCPQGSKNYFANFSTLPADSSASFAKWYKRLILDNPDFTVFLQEKARFSVSAAGDLFEGRENILVSSGVECLLRFRDQDTGNVFGPGPWTKEETKDAHGKKIELGLFEALDVFWQYFPFMQEQLKEILFEMSDSKFDFSINVRGDELEHANYFKDFENLIIDTGKTRMSGKRSYKIEPQRIKIEILESHLHAKNPQVVANLKNFQRIGVKISLDDYWSNESWETRIRELDDEGIVIDEIKLDGSYLPRLEEEYKLTGKVERARADVLRLRSLTGKHTTIVLEKVETIIQAQLAQWAGVDEIQGWLHHKPTASDTYKLDRIKRETQREVSYTIGSIQ